MNDVKTKSMLVRRKPSNEIKNRKVETKSAEID